MSNPEATVVPSVAGSNNSRTESTPGGFLDLLAGAAIASYFTLLPEESSVHQEAEFQSDAVTLHHRSAVASLRTELSLTTSERHVRQTSRPVESTKPWADREAAVPSPIRPSRWTAGTLVDSFFASNQSIALPSSHNLTQVGSSQSVAASFNAPIRQLSAGVLSSTVQASGINGTDLVKSLLGHGPQGYSSIPSWMLGEGEDPTGVSTPPPPPSTPPPGPTPTPMPIPTPTCQTIDSIHSDPGTTVYADDSVILTANLDATTGDTAPDMYMWTKGGTGVGTGKSFAPTTLDVGTQTYTITGTCSMSGASSSKSLTLTVNPVKVNSVSVTKSGGNMTYPNTIYVGDIVDFGATFDVAGHQPDSLAWKLIFVDEHLTDVGNTFVPTSTTTVESTGTGIPMWTGVTVSRATTEPYATDIAKYYKIEVTATSGGVTSVKSKTFEVTPYEAVGIVKLSGGGNEGDTHEYKVVTDPGIDPVGTYSWNRTRTSAWGSSDGAATSGTTRTVTYDEVDPGEWQITVTMTSGGHVSMASTNVRIEPAKATGYSVVSAEVSQEPVSSFYPGPVLIVTLAWTSSTGRIADLDHGRAFEKLTFHLADGTTPAQFTSDSPFIKTSQSNPLYNEGAPSMRLWLGGFVDNYSALNVHMPVQQGSLITDQVYYAYYDDSPTPTAKTGIPGSNTIVRYIELDADNNLRYRITSHGGEAIGPVPGQAGN